MACARRTGKRLIDHRSLDMWPVCSGARARVIESHLPSASGQGCRQQEASRHVGPKTIHHRACKAASGTRRLAAPADERHRVDHGNRRDAGLVPAAQCRRERDGGALPDGDAGCLWPVPAADVGMAALAQRGGWRVGERLRRPRQQRGAGHLGMGRPRRHLRRRRWFRHVERAIRIDPGCFGRQQTHRRRRWRSRTADPGDSGSAGRRRSRHRRCRLGGMVGAGIDGRASGGRGAGRRAVSTHARRAGARLVVVVRSPHAMAADRRADVLHRGRRGRAAPGAASNDVAGAIQGR